MVTHQFKKRLLVTVNKIADKQRMGYHLLALKSRLAHVTPGVLGISAIGIAVLGDHAANGDTCLLVQQRQHRLINPPADTLKINITTIGTGGAQAAGQVLIEVGDTGVQAQLIQAELHLAGSPGNTHHPAAGKPGQLRHHLANAAGRGRHHHCFTGPRLALHHQARIGRKTQHTHNANGCGDGRLLRIQLTRAHITKLRNSCTRKAMALPAIGIKDIVTRLVGRYLAGQDPGHGAPVTDLTGQLNAAATPTPLIGVH